MIFMKINTHDYENDVRVMTGAFFPGEKIIIDENLISKCAITVDTYFDGASVEIKIKNASDEFDVSFVSESNDKKIIRNRLKRELYYIFSKITGKGLPWGTLTGIRPTKIPYALIAEGKTDDYIYEHLKAEYLTNDKKTALSMEVAHNEYRLLSEIDYKNTYSLYVGIPFCPTTCLYCSFTSYPLSMWKSRVDEYLDALIKELTYLGGVLKDKKAISVYIGGGTPTTLLPEQSDRLIAAIKANFDLSELREFTVEAGRPDSVDRDKLMHLKAAGVDRISINPQTMNQKTLDIIGRRHSVSDVKSAFNLARECGFDNINMDLIIGLPDEGIEEVKNTLAEVQNLGPDSLTVHSLAIKRAARLNIFKDEYSDYSITNTDEIIDCTYDFAKNKGLLPYYLYRQKNMAGNFENVGYAKENCFGLYNILIMEEKQSIYAAGAGASSKILFYNEDGDGDRIERIENVKDVKTYIERIDDMIERKKTFFNEG